MICLERWEVISAYSWWPLGDYPGPGLSYQTMFLVRGYIMYIVSAQAGYLSLNLGLIFFKLIVLIPRHNFYQTNKNIMEISTEWRNIPLIYHSSWVYVISILCIYCPIFPVITMYKLMCSKYRSNFFTKVTGKYVCYYKNLLLLTGT